MASETNSFSIAHYILLIAMVAACGGIVAYAIIHDTGAYQDTIAAPAPGTDQQPQADNECVKRVADAVAQMWAYNPESVPEKYTNIAMARLTTLVEVTQRGECNGVKFVCAPGSRPADCDPCAIGNARDYAIAAQTRDMIQKHCTQ